MRSALAGTLCASLTYVTAVRVYVCDWVLLLCQHIPQSHMALPWLPFSPAAALQSLHPQISWLSAERAGLGQRVRRGL